MSLLCVFYLSRSIKCTSWFTWIIHNNDKTNTFESKVLWNTIDVLKMRHYEEMVMEVCVEVCVCELTQSTRQYIYS